MGDSEDFDRAVKEAIDWWHELHRAGNSGAGIIGAFEDGVETEQDLATRKALEFVLRLVRAAERKREIEECTGRSDSVDAMYRWYAVVDRVLPGIDRSEEFQERLDRIDLIEARLRRERDAAARRELSLILEHQFKILGEYGVAEAILLELFHGEPEDPIPLVRLAEQKLYFEKLYDVAMRIIDQAIQVAYRSGNFRRNALSVKARIALGMEDYKTVEGLLQEIMGLEFAPDNVDTGIMRDIYDRLPAGSIDPAIASRYAEYSRFPL
jgi:hypothetical protein